MRADRSLLSRYISRSTSQSLVLIARKNILPVCSVRWPTQLANEKFMTPPKYGDRHATLCPLTLCIKFPLYCKKFCAKVHGIKFGVICPEKNCMRREESTMSIILLIEKRLFLRNCLHDCLDRSYPDHEIVAFGSLAEWRKLSEEKKTEACCGHLFRPCGNRADDEERIRAARSDYT